MSKLELTKTRRRIRPIIGQMLEKLVNDHIRYLSNNKGLLEPLDEGIILTMEIPKLEALKKERLDIYDALERGDVEKPDWFFDIYGAIPDNDDMSVELMIFDLEYQREMIENSLYIIYEAIEDKKRKGSKDTLSAGWRCIG